MKQNSKELCPLCGGIKSAGVITFTTDLKSTIVVIREVPATVCSLCGNEWISDAVAEKIEGIIEDARMKQHLLEVTNFPNSIMPASGVEKWTNGKTTKPGF